MSLSADLIILAPELSTDTRIQFFIDRAALRVNRRVFGSKADFATILLAAHMLTRFAADQVASVSGSVIMEKVGDLQDQFAVLQMKGDEELATTTYGAQFAQLRKGVQITPLVT